MITMINWRLDIPSSDRLIGETGENLASVISISTDAGPDWTYWLYMCYADHTSMALPLSWEDGTLRGKLTSPYLPMAGPVMVTIQGQKEAVWIPRWTTGSSPTGTRRTSTPLRPSAAWKKSQIDVFWKSGMEE